MTSTSSSGYHVDMSNTSNVAVEILAASFWIQHVAPLTDEEVEALHDDFMENPSSEKYLPYPALNEFDRTWIPDEFVIEPGETDTDRYEFIVGRTSRTISVGCFFSNSSQNSNLASSRGWTATTVVDLD